jgi:hypothetical protein
VVANVRLRVLVAAAVPLRLAGEKDDVTPAGKPATESATVELNPFSGVFVTTIEAVFPAVAFKGEEPVDRVKVGLRMTRETEEV